MNAFRKLLLAPVVLGLAAPVAAQAQSFDMGNVNRYTQQQDTDRMRALEAQMGQVTSVSQFSDVYPTDWAYQALANLVETYGCVAGYPDGTFKGNIALTRYEAAALLNACLDRVTEITEELKRLMKEFEKELVVLKARVDGLEAQTAELAATQFSTTTKLSGVAYFWLGGAVYNDSGYSPIQNAGLAGAEITAYQDAIENNGLAMAPGGALYNYATENAVPPTSKFGLGKILTKGATWVGSTGAGGVANTNAYDGNPTTYAGANAANITVASTVNNAVPVTVADLTGGASTGALAVTGLRGNGLNVGTPGLRTNDIPAGIGLTPGNFRKNVIGTTYVQGLDKTGVTLGGFELDTVDLGNLIRLGNASRRAKSAVMIGYEDNVVAGSPGFVATDGYTVAAGGYFTNTNVYTDPFNLSVAEYGSLGPIQANQKYVKNAARTLLKDLFYGEVALGEAVSFNYDTRLDFNTSFTGKDLLRTRLRSGNFQGNTFAGNPFPVTGAEIAFEEGAQGFNVNRLFYQFPVGDSWTVTAGPFVRQDDMLAVWPSQYPAETIMDFFTYAGAPGAYSLNLGAGAGLSYAGDILGMDGFAVSANYVANGGNESFSNSSSQSDAALLGGIANENSRGTGTVQIAYTGDDWNLTAAYAYNQGGAYGYIPVGTPMAGDPFGGLSNFSVSSVAISGWFAPEDWGRWMPSVSAGWGLNGYTANADASVWGISAVDEGDNAESQSWYVGLQWPDVFLQGNYLGTAVGQPTFISSNDSFLESDESTFAWEIWYKFQVTDNIAVTPAYFFIDNPSGLGNGGNVQGGVLKTTFTF
ncbi:Porin, P stress induced [Synechococcus sp. RCC307]|nr:Porin, P stress induced [Synechococcus sp. RCC307]